jgi:hypothetical protein
MTDSPNGDHIGDHIDWNAEAQRQHLSPLRQELDLLIEANKAGLTELARQGAQVDPAGLLSLRIDTLAELVLSEPGMLQFQLRFERKVSQVIEEIRGQVRKAQLAAGAQVSPQQMKQMAQQQGLLGPDGQPFRR